jgi:hypothetical protein
MRRWLSSVCAGKGGEAGTRISEVPRKGEPVAAGNARLPVVSIQMSPSPSERDLYEEILAAMGGIFTHGTSVTNLRHRIRSTAACAVGQEHRSRAPPSRREPPQYQDGRSRSNEPNCPSLLFASAGAGSKSDSCRQAVGLAECESVGAASTAGACATVVFVGAPVFGPTCRSIGTRLSTVTLLFSLGEAFQRSFLDGR